VGVLAGSLAEIAKKHPKNVQPHIAQFVRGDENGFTALNTAFLVDGAFISIPQDVVFEKVIQILFVAAHNDAAIAVQPRNIILAATASQCKIVETYAGPDGAVYLTNAVTEVHLKDGAIVEHNRIQVEGCDSFHVSTVHVQLEKASRYRSNAVGLGGSIVRNNITAVFHGEGGECILNGLTVESGTQVVDNHTTIDHAVPHCESHELYKAILDDASKGVFNGKVFVRKDAQKTDAKQTNKTLLLSDDASINAKPQLEIFADDVKCTHGATIGQLDAEQIFYLRTRGIDENAARDILTSAFARDVIDRMSIEPLRSIVDHMVQSRLNENHR
jgi:Fe-S cluster assembly protein SufD